MKLAKPPGAARGVYATADWSYVLEKVRGSWFLRRNTGVGHGILGCWTGSASDALVWAQRYLDGTHTIDGEPIVREIDVHTWRLGDATSCNGCSTAAQVAVVLHVGRNETRLCHGCLDLLLARLKRV